jgi:hypothetical protein
MRKVAWLLVILPCLAMGQLVQPVVTGNYNSTDFLRRWNTGRADSTGRIQLVAMTSTLTDTTMGYETTNFKTLLVSVVVNDTCTILVSYQLSTDGVTWGVPSTTAGAQGTNAPYDSVKCKINANVVKTIDFTSVATSRYIRWIFAVDVKAYVLGVPSPKYSAWYLFKRF